MKTQPTIRLLAIICLSALASCASQPKSVKVPVSTMLQPNTSVSSQVFQSVNNYRSSLGATELQRHAGLDHLAQQHCEYLRQHRGTFKLNGKNVSHIGFEGRALYARARYQMDNISENVASATGIGGNPAPVLLALWKSSKDHNKNMTDSWTHSGVGVVVDADGTVFADQLFATVSNSQFASRSRFNRF
jgi:uncharacterized protein YkwD